MGAGRSGLVADSRRDDTHGVLLLRVFRGKRMCVRAVIRKDFETNARKFLGTVS